MKFTLNMRITGLSHYLDKKKVRVSLSGAAPGCFLDGKLDVPENEGKKLCVGSEVSV